MSNPFDTEGQQLPKSGLLLLQFLILALFLVFALRLWYLQVHKGDIFSEKARENRFRQESIFAPRGLIRDRNGKYLAINEPAYALGLIREDCLDVSATLDQVSKWSGVPRQELQEAYDKGKKRTKSFEPQIILQHLSYDLLTTIEANSLFWPGLEVIVRPRRYYPQGKLLSHVLGYVAEANEEELEKDDRLALGDTVGKQGVEFTLEQRLRGKKGLKHLEVDAHGRSLSEHLVRESATGENITLALDLELQALAMRLLEGQAGVAVVMDPNNGQVLALASQPSFDNNTFVMGLSGEQWRTLRDDPRHPMQNRATMSTYPPGSVWKLVMAGAGLNNGFLKPTDRTFCPGGYNLGGRVFRCWKKGGHGTVDLLNGLIHSCDVYFYALGERMGPDRIHEYGVKAGFGQPTGVALPHEKAGVVPSREWKWRRFHDKWHAGETLNISIGQGYVLTTPLQVARFVSALLNGGTLYKPNLVASDPSEVVGQLPSTDQQREIILRAMVETVERGTAKRLQTKGAIIGGKTGTAQVVKLMEAYDEKKTREIPYKYRDHAWIASFGVKDDKAAVIVVMVEHGGHGGEAAVPVAKALYDHIFGTGVPELLYAPLGR